MGGWAQGTSGDATNNTVEMTETAKVYSTGAGVFGVTGVYGGWSRGGNATNNTIVLSGEMSGYGDTILFGGHSETSGTDVTTGNMLWVKKEGNSAYSIFRFQKMKFSLASVSPNDVMLKVNTNYGATQGFKWSDIEVENPSAWQNGAVGSKRVTLYQGPTIQLTNYDATSPVNGTSGDYEYGLTTNTTAAPGTSTVGASEIYFDRNKFKNAKVTYDASNPLVASETTVYAGTSTLGNTTTNNKLTIDGLALNASSTKYYGGYTQSSTGDSTKNEVVLTNMPLFAGSMAYNYVYGGWSNQGNATNNTVTLGGTGGSNYNSMYGETFLYGGFSNNSGADARTGNTLKIIAKDSGARSIQNFEKMKFVLGNGIGSGDTMLYVRWADGGTQTFDWKNITVTGLSDWVTALNAAGTNDPKLTLYTGAAITLNNYAPRLIENAGDYEFGTFATGGTLASGTMTNATQIKLAGNKFQNVTSPVVDAATSSVHGGYSSYGNTTNTNVITVNSGAYTNVRAGYTDAVKGGSDKNELTFTGTASATNLYGGYTTGTSASAADLKTDAAAKADAKGNTVNISGGTVNANGKIAGGYIAQNTTLATPAASAGNASGNTINITGGTFGGNTVIYGGYTEGTGKATGNTVNLKADSLAMGGAFLYGGGSSGSASDATSDNTLSVAGKDITVRGVANFAKMNFDVSHRTAGDTLLKVTGGATGGLDWAGVEVTPKDFAFTPKTYEKRLFTLMENTAGISFMQGTTNTYNPIGAKECTNGDFEYVIDTDNHTVNAAKYVYVDGFQFKNNQAAKFETADGTKDAAWAGRTAVGNKVEKNTLTVTGGSLKNVYGGLVENTKRDKTTGQSLTTGDADGNTLILKKDGANPAPTITGTGAGNAYGAEVRTKDGNATNNKAILSAGSVAGSVYGGAVTAMGATGKATGNSVTITGDATVGGDVYGGFAAGTGATTGNTVNLGDGTAAGKITLAAGTASVTGTVYGGSGATSTNNVLNVNGNATVGNIQHFDKVNFNYDSSTTNAANPMLTLSGGAVTDFDWKKFAYNGSAPTSGRLVLMQNAANINVANYTGAKELAGGGDTSEATIDTNNSSATATQIILGGYTFKGATASLNAGSATEDVWAGRSVIGNTTTGNTLTVNGATHRDAYGGWTAGTGTSKALKNNSTGNTVNLAGGTVRNIYGGFTSSDGGSATGNKVNISGGTVASASGVGGTVYGGYISSATSAGDATGNTVTITGGTVGDVYAGYTNGTGKTTGNTVNLGDGTNAMASGTSITGTLAGGNQATATDNTLNVNTNAAVGNIKNFAKISFKLDGAVNASDALLKLTGGATTGLDWAGVDVTPANYTFTPKTYEKRLFTLMENAAGISFMKNGDNTYSPLGAKERTSGGKYEYVIDTDNHSVNATRYVYVDGYQFKDNQAAYTAADGSHTEAWAGRTAVGNKVEGNALKVEGGTLTAAAYGGLVENNKLTAGGQPLTTGDAEKNTLTVTGGSVADGYGAKVTTKDGAAKTNTAEISSGTVTGSLYGGAITAAGATKDATGNKVNLTGGAVTGSVYGGALTGAGATGNATGNTVTIAGGAVTGDVHGAALTRADAAGEATKNIVNISAGTVGGTVYGAKNAGTSAATGSTITITGGTLHDVYGGHAASGATTGNTVNLGTADTPAGAAGTPVAAGTSIGNIYGGNQASVTGNVLNVYDSVTAANVDKFEKVNFNVTANVAAGDTLLTLTNGAASHIDWNKMSLNNLNALVPSNTTGHLLTLVNSTGNVTFDNYAGKGAIENKKDGDYEYVINTDSHSGTAKKVDVTGYRFRNNTNATYASGTDAEVWAGRTKVGNTVTKNKLTVTGGTPTAVYGGIAENFEHVTGGTEKPTGDATENTLILKTGASVTKAYGADVRTLSGNATKNGVTLAGGTVTGSLYGGALTKAGATGSATGNTVTITGGTVGGDVYAGYTSGTGKTTDNTVSLGDGTNAVAAGTTVTGVIYGGSSAADTTGNVLNVNAKGVTAGSVANFAKIRFKIDSSVADGDDVLTLTQNTTLAHSSIEEPTPAVISGWLGNTMEKTAHLIKMNGSTLNLTGYTPGSSRSRRGDVEYAYKTDNDAVSTTGSLDLFAYKWQNAGVEINSNAHADVFGGKSTLGTTGETLKNKLTLKTGASVTNAVAGDTQTANGTATGNTVKIEAGTATNAVGGKTLAGKASGNTAEAAGGNVTNLKGAESTSGLVQENHAKITAGTVDTAVGAESTNGAAAGNDVTITGGTVTNAMGAHTTLAGDATENHAVISGGTVTGSLKGAQSAGKAVKNTVEVKGGDLSGASVMGAEAAGDADSNSVTISVTPTSNAATVITGAHSTGGSAVNNTVNITADVTGSIMGAQASGAASQNVINIENATVTGNVTGGSGAVTADNVINLKGATVSGDVVGGTAGDTGNTLAVRYSAAHPTSHINDFSNIKRLHFYLGGEVDSNTPTLLQLGALTKDITNLDVGVGVSGRANRLTVGDTISLMKVAPGGTLTMGTPTQDNKTTGMQGVSLLYEFSLTNRSTDELVAKVLKVAVNEKNKSFAETRAAATDFINRGADLLAGAGISSARKEAAGDKMDGKMHGYHIWAAMSQGTMRAETGSYADTKGYNLSLGWAKEQNVKAGKLLFTPFVEYGKGSYDSYLDDGTHGSGKISYLGGGVMGRIEKANGIWAEAALHAGRAQSDYAGSIFAGTTSRYDGSSGYYAAHFGIGKMRKIGTSDGLNTYLRYFYSKQDGMSTQLNTGEDYDFGAVASHRLRLGFTYSHRENAGKELYAGLAYEYEFDGTATASYQSFNAPSPSLTGGSVMVELGYRFAPKGSRVSYDLHMTGWQGKRRGVTGGAQVNWAF